MKICRDVFIGTSFIAFLNFLFFLLTYRFLTYHFLSLQEMVGQQGPFFLIALNLAFAGFALAILLSKSAKAKALFKVGPISNLLSILIICLGAASFIKEVSFSLSLIIVCIIIFLPSFLFGCLFSYFSGTNLPHNHFVVFYMLIGSAAATLVHHFIFDYLPFLIAYCLIALMLQAARFFFVRSWQPLIVIFILLMTTLMILHPAKYQKPYYLKNSAYEYNHSVRGHYSVLDVLYDASSDQFLMISHKQSPTSIAIKGSLLSVQNHTIIPYLLRNYSSSLIIGIGGGQDIVPALYFDTKKITAVEADRQRLDLMHTYFRNYSNSLLFDERLSVVHNNGRSFLKEDAKKYDLIYIGRPFTKLYSNTRYPYDLSGTLFTEDALDEYLRHLNEGGVLVWAGSSEKYHFHRLMVPIKNRLPSIQDNLAILYPYHDSSFVVILVGKEFDFSEFYKKQRSTKIYILLYSLSISWFY